MTIDPPKNKILTVIIHVRLWILVEYYDELGTPQGRWWRVDDSTIWTMIDLGGELILWVSQVILRKYLCPLFVVTAGTQNYKKKTSQRCRRHFGNTRDIHAICWFCVNLCKECLRRPLNKSRHQNPPGTRTIIQGTAYRYGTFHPEMPQKYRNFQTCPNVGKLWHFGNISVVRKLHKIKVRPPGSSGNWSCNEMWCG